MLKIVYALLQNGEDLRQYAARLKHHDIIALIDQVKFSLVSHFHRHKCAAILNRELSWHFGMFQMAAHAIFEQNEQQLKYAISRDDECDVNFMHQVTWE